MKYSVERIEEKIALCEDDYGEVLKINIADLPEKICEGDIIIKTSEGYEIDPDETEARRRKMAQLQKNIFGRKKS